MRAASIVLVLATCILAIATVQADTPANCSYSGFIGHWSVLASAPTVPSTNCSITRSSIVVPGLTLSAPNIAKDDKGNMGNWTMIYNQGVEVWVAGRIYFAYSGWSGAESQCGRTQDGWAHDMDGSNWNCFSATKDATEEDGHVDQEETKIILHEDEFKPAASPLTVRQSAAYRVNHAFLADVNAAQSMFTVKSYPQFEGQSVRDLQRTRGSHDGAALRDAMPSAAQMSGAPSLMRSNAASIPDEFDWRNVSGVNYVSPIRNQGSCGSCFAFSSTGMLESRIRIRSANSAKPILSTQDVVSCSFYAQGCEGGFPYLIAGKYGRDFGLVEEACYPYTGKDSKCRPDPQPGCKEQRWFTNEYYYVGGYYGASSVQSMQDEIMANGPISVSFMVYSDFMHYSGGVYTHQFTNHLEDELNPFELVNHAVLAVGWGVTEDGTNTPYWIVKNSWGASWGEEGYFRILRGASNVGGECEIESIPVAAMPRMH